MSEDTTQNQAGAQDAAPTQDAPQDGPVTQFAVVLLLAVKFGFLRDGLIDRVRQAEAGGATGDEITALLAGIVDEAKAAAHAA